MKKSTDRIRGIPTFIWLPATISTLAVLLLTIFAFEGQTDRESRHGARLSDGFQPPEMAAIQFSRADVIGNLGGMPVKIPYYFANYVEYDGDPGWGEKRTKGSRAPQRTYDSRIRSFGFPVRYPDMEGLKDAEMLENKRSYTIYNTSWISAGFNSGEDVPPSGWLDRRAHFFLEVPNTVLPERNYERLSTTLFGLEMYVPKGINPKTNRPYREDKSTDDVFVSRDNEGHVKTYIYCSNVPTDAAPCDQSFSLEPHAKVQVYVHYRRGLLSDWRSIQEKVCRLTLSFKQTN